MKQHTGESMLLTVLICRRKCWLWNWRKNCHRDGYFVGLTFPEVGPGSVSIGAATSDNFADTADELMVYEASYSYPVNDSMTITPESSLKKIWRWSNRRTC